MKAVDWFTTPVVPLSTNQHPKYSPKAAYDTRKSSGLVSTTVLVGAVVPICAVDAHQPILAGASFEKYARVGVRFNPCSPIYTVAPW